MLKGTAPLRSKLMRREQRRRSSGREPEEEEANEERATRNVGCNSDVFTICVRDQTGDLTLLRVRPQTAFRTIINTFAARTGVWARELEFMLDEDKINRQDTCAELDLEEGDQVDLILVQYGC